MRRLFATSFLFGSALLILCGSGSAQTIDQARWTGAPTPPGRPAGFGTGLSVLTLWSFDLSASDSDDTWSFTGDFQRYATSFSEFLGSVRLPSGALVESIELEACDSSGTGEAFAAFRSKTVPAGFEAVHGLLSTGVLATPGCALFAHTLATPVTIDNKNVNYIVVLTNNSHDGTTSLGALRLYYRLQVSPAPGVATFGDVATSHPFFRFIEALAASGITAGCGEGNYCPSRNITRGEMAVFLSKALGLHFPD